MYTIGLIDDENNELKTIRRTIKIHADSQGITYGFKTYEIPQRTSDIVSDLFEEVIKDIEKSVISILIIDYKILDSTQKRIKGTDILKLIKERVVQFPVVILTQVVSESTIPNFVDADKVYEKRRFFDLDDDYSKEKVKNIFDNMIKYVEQKDCMTIQLRELQSKLSTGDRSVIKDILETERKLDGFVPTDQTSFDIVFSEERMRQFTHLYEKIEKILN